MAYEVFELSIQGVGSYRDKKKYVAHRRHLKTDQLMILLGQGRRVRNRSEPRLEAHQHLEIW